MVKKDNSSKNKKKPFVKTNLSPSKDVEDSEDFIETKNKSSKKTPLEGKDLDKYIEEEFMDLDQFITFKTKQNLPTLLYTSLVFKWIPSDRLIIVVNSTKQGYHLELYLKSFKFSSVFLDPEMPVNTNKHNSQQFLKGNFKICIINDKYNKNSPDYPRELADECPISPVIIYYETINLELLKYHHQYHSNIKTIYHFMTNDSKQKFYQEYNDLPKELIFIDYKYDQEQVDHLNYRCEDIYNSISKNDIKKAKMKRINIELIKSKNMEKYFNENPEEKQLVLKSIQENQVNVTRPSVSYLPEYLIHDDNRNNVIEQAIKVNYGKEGEKEKKKRKKRKMEKYLANLEEKGNEKEDEIGIEVEDQENDPNDDEGFKEGDFEI